jgi:hypothetical protein
MNTVAPIARLFGKRAIYKKYSDIEKWLLFIYKYNYIINKKEKLNF